MKIIKFIGISIALAATCLLLSGCADSAHDSDLPWGRPADWEGGLPGFGTGSR